VSALWVVGISICVPLAAIGLYSLQVRLEQWDHDRHAED
jgi:hypothetical protein